MIEQEIDNFSISVLRYDRKKPRANQRSPGEIIEEVEERMAANTARRASVRKWLGALLLSVSSAAMMALLTTGWPWLLKLITTGGHG